MDEHMTGEPATTAVGVGAAIKAFGLKAVAGMIGAALLYLALPPINPDGTFNRREFVLRLACAGVFSCYLGDWAVQQLAQHWPSLHADQHASTVYLMVGAPGWWVTRAVALLIRRNENKDIAEVVRDLKDAK